MLYSAEKACCDSINETNSPCCVDFEISLKIIMLGYDSQSYGNIFFKLQLVKYMCINGSTYMK